MVKLQDYTNNIKENEDIILFIKINTDLECAKRGKGI